MKRRTLHELTKELEQLKVERQIIPVRIKALQAAIKSRSLKEKN